MHEKYKMHKMLNSYIVVLNLCLSSVVHCFDVYVDQSDFDTARPGDRRTLECLIEDLTDDVDECIWTSPKEEDFDKYTNDNNIEVRLNQRGSDGGCQIHIDRVFQEHNGPWMCSIKEYRGETIKRFAYLVVTGHDDVQIQSSPSIYEARTGDEIEMVCPTNFGKVTKSICIWRDRYGNKYKPFENRHDNSDSRDRSVRAGGNIRKGQCGIKIDPVQRRHFGGWKCTVLRQRRDYRTGSELVTSKVILKDQDDYRRSDREEETLQGHEEGDRNVELTLELPLDRNEVENSRFFWIIQRKYVVKVEPEGYYRNREGTCPRDKDECYFTSDVSLISGERNRYEVSIEFERLRRRDIENPVVLVQEYRRHGRSRSSEVRIFFLPKEDPMTFRGFDDRRRSDDDCVINGENIAIGDAYEDQYLCVKAKCMGHSRIELSESRLGRC